MINCNENENDNKKKIIWLKNLDVDMDTNIQNIVYLGKIKSICNKQHISNIWASIYQKVKQRWGWAEKKRWL